MANQIEGGWNPTGGTTVTDDSAVRNNKGTIRNGGNIAGSLFRNEDLRDTHYFINVVSGVNGAVAATAGTFNGGNWVIRRVTTDIAGVTNYAIYKGSDSANDSESINQLVSNKEFLYKTSVRTSGWQEFNGEFSPAVSATISGMWDQTTDTDKAADARVSSTDHAANPTAATPGELVYRTGKKLPVQDDYKAKTSF